jgi:hypothetical protein
LRLGFPPAQLGRLLRQQEDQPCAERESPGTDQSKQHEIDSRSPNNGQTWQPFRKAVTSPGSFSLLTLAAGSVF